MKMRNLPDLVGTLILQYAPTRPLRPMGPSLSLRNDLSIDSLTLVTLMLRLGDELGVDLFDLDGGGVDFSHLDTVGDLVALAETLDTGGSYGNPTVA